MKDYYREVRECIKHLDKFSIFQFKVPCNNKIYTFITHCHEDSYNFTMFLFNITA